MVALDDDGLAPGPGDGSDETSRFLDLFRHASGASAMDLCPAVGIMEIVMIATPEVEGVVQDLD